MNITERINEVLIDNNSLRQVEPHIYTVIEEDSSASYDKWGGIYEAVACNRLYNRLVWGYWTSEFHKFCLDALKSGDGWVLDAGCGSLAFTARAYLEQTSRPVILSDQSIWMLRAAKNRIIKLNGSIPDNMIFLHADAMQLPLRDDHIQTVLAMNLLHAVQDANKVVKELKRVGKSDGSISITTIVKSGRFADSYLHKLAKGGALIERTLNQLISIVAELEMEGSYCTKGNLAFVNLGTSLDYFSSTDCMNITFKE